MKSKKIVVVVYADEEVGFGHWYRIQALVRTLEEREHLVWVVGNVMAHGHNYYQIRPGERNDLYHVFDIVRPDIIVADLQTRVPDYLYELSMQFGTKVVVLNGVGYDWEQDADLAIIQGFSDIKADNTLSGPEYVILRDEIHKFANMGLMREPGSWLVWGGAADRLGLLNKFAELFSERPARLMASKYVTDGITPGSQIQLVYTTDSGEEFIPIMATSEKAFVAMGMICWELATLGIPAYVFSRSEGHLGFAKKMDEQGLIKAWRAVGLPNDNEIAEFLYTPFEVNGILPDREATTRIAQAMEEL